MWRNTLLALLMVSSAAYGRELHWDELDVTATLDDHGVLHVSERQAIVFTGDWNGGERTFDLRPGQSVSIERMTRVDPATGERTEMGEGSLDVVNGWALVDDKTLRWRSRTPDDPPFANTRIDYVIDYTLTNVLRAQADGTYRLRHDFVFSKRDGQIRKFKLNFGLDNSWRVITGGPVSITAGPFDPGENYVVTTVIAGGALPVPSFADVLRENSSIVWRVGSILAAAFGSLLLWLLFLRREQSLLRFQPPDRTADWDAVEAMTDLKAEIAAAMRDGVVGNSAVAALLARLTAEGKIKSWSRGNTLHLELVANMDSFNEYEGELLNALLLGGTTTSTEKVKAHYQATGFNPVSLIRRNVERAVEAVTNEPFKIGAPFMALGWMSFIGAVIAAAVALYSFEPRRRPPFVFGAIGIGIFMLFAGLVQVVNAEKWRKDDRAQPDETSQFMRAPLIGMAMAILVALFAPANAVVAATIYASLLMFMSCAMALASGATRIGPVRRSWLARIEGARSFLNGEISEKRSMDERLMPWIVALGLADSASLVVAAPAGSTSRSNNTYDSDSSTSTSSSSSSDSRSYGGGGGAFGGAGASGSWAAAAAGMASGVAAPASSSSGSDSGSSSSSDSGGGSSSSDSGGGGGGGW